MSAPDDDEIGQLIEQARTGDAAARGRLLERYGSYLGLLARLHIGRRLQGKADPSDLAPEAFLKAHKDFAGFRGSSEAELTAWLRQLLATSLAALVRRYLGTRRRDVRLEQELAEELDQSSRLLDRALVAGHSTPSERAARREQAVALA